MSLEWTRQVQLQRLKLQNAPGRIVGRLGRLTLANWAAYAGCLSLGAGWEGGVAGNHAYNATELLVTSISHE